MQPGFDGGRADRVAPVQRDVAVRAFELGLERLEHVTDEGPGAGLEFELIGGEGQVHAAKDAARDGFRTGPVARPGTLRRGAPRRGQVEATPDVTTRCTFDTDERGSTTNPAFPAVWSSIHEAFMPEVHLVDARCGSRAPGRSGDQVVQVEDLEGIR